MHKVTWIDLALLNYRYEKLLTLLETNEIYPDRVSSTALLMASMNVARSEGSSKEDYLAWTELMWDSMKENPRQPPDAAQN